MDIIIVRYFEEQSKEMDEGARGPAGALVRAVAVAALRVHRLD
jgi:hypothetical protein